LAFLPLKNGEKPRVVEQVHWIITLIGLFVWIAAAWLSDFLIQTRLYYALFPSFALAAGSGFKQIISVRIGLVRIGRVVSALVIFVVLLILIQYCVHTIQSDTLRYLTSGSTEEEFLETNLGWYARAMKSVRELPKNARVLMLWEPRSLYCLPKCVPDEVIDRWKHHRMFWNEPNKILDTWRLEGFNYLLLYRYGADFVQQEDNRFLPDDWVTLDELLSHLPPPVDFGGVYSLYSLEP
jgi:hypothetical protein